MDLSTPTPLTFDLTAVEARILGCLIEKESTTPDQYPLSTNALVSACNQKTSRDPVMAVSEQEVDAAIMSLRERGLVRSLRPSGSRTWKHRHVTTEVVPFDDAALAVVAVLMLRGGQTAGELRTRTERIYKFGDTDEVDQVLAKLLAAPQPFVRNVGRESGQSQDRYENCLSDAHETADVSQQRAMFHRFSELHEQGLFVMPNPWDIGSAGRFEAAGAEALATTSSGYARSLGRNDQELGRQELVEHAAALVGSVGVPLNVDSEMLYPDEPGGISESVRLLASTGAAGCSIEDFDSKSGHILPVEEATARVAEAVQACRTHGLFLTARAENYLRQNRDLDDTLARLLSFEEVGADVSYAPGLSDLDEIEIVADSCQRPINVLLWPDGPSVQELASVGVRRVSTGGALFVEAYALAETRVRALLAPSPSTENQG